MPLCAPPDTTTQSSLRPTELSPLLTTQTPSPEPLRRATTSDREPRNQAAKPVDPSLKTASWVSECYLSAGTAPQRGTKAEGILLITKPKPLDHRWAATITMVADVGAPTWSSARTKGRPLQGRHIDEHLENLAMVILVPIPNPRTTSSNSSSTPSAGTQTFRKEHLSVRERRAMLVLPPQSPSLA